MGYYTPMWFAIAALIVGGLLAARTAASEAGRGRRTRAWIFAAVAAVTLPLGVLLVPALLMTPAPADCPGCE